MKCTASNGYAGWLVREESTGDKIENVVWIDPDLLVYCAYDEPLRIIGVEVARTVYRVQDIRVDRAASTFWIKRAPVMVAPLSPGRQQDQQPTDKPCADCCQPDTCRRIDYCAAHRCDFGAKAP